MRLPAKDSATYRGIITSIQTFCGFLIALAAQPETIQLLQQYYGWIVPVVVAGSGIASLVLNILRPSVKNY